MRLTVEGFALKIARIRRALDHLGTHLDDEISLSQLAELTCLSASQFERLYITKIGEPPMATLRRLRLKRSYEQLRIAQLSGTTGGHSKTYPNGIPADRAARLMDVAMAASYGSHPAFTRAFIRQFGHAPSRFPPNAAPLDRPPELRLEVLPTREVFQMAYRGSDRERNRAIGHLMGKLAVAGARQWRTWAILDRDNPLSARPETCVEVTHFVPACGQPQTVRGVDRFVHQGCLYAVHEALVSQQPAHYSALAERVRRELSCEISEGAFGGRIVTRDITFPWYTAPQERRIALYIPVAAAGKASDLSVSMQA